MCRFELAREMRKDDEFNTCIYNIYVLYASFVLRSLPDPSVSSKKTKTKSQTPTANIPGAACLSELSLFDSRFGPVPHQRPPVVTTSQIKHPDAPEFSNCHRFFHQENLTVTREIAAMKEEGTQEQPECLLWKEKLQPRVTACRFCEVCHVQGKSSGQSLAAELSQRCLTS